VIEAVTTMVCGLKLLLYAQVIYVWFDALLGYISALIVVLL
jgi:hypothetical protein